MNSEFVWSGDGRGDCLVYDFIHACRDFCRRNPQINSGMLINLAAHSSSVRSDTQLKFISEGKQAMNENLEEGRRAMAAIQAAWNEAARRWNPEALTAIYTADALFFGGRPHHSVGAGEVREYFASYEGVIESATLDLVAQHIIRLTPDCFLAQGFGDFSFVLSGKRTSQSHLRTTLVIVLRQGEWRILQHHFSVPPDAPPI
jgi:uncharacterized protein (TIGR02246 family)